jgi:hypothetical protein
VKQADLEKMSETELNRWNIFEALLFGIYGNWLIAFLDKVSFLRVPINLNIFGFWYQSVCVGLAFFCLPLLFYISIFKSKETKRSFILVLYFGHLIGILGALFVEQWTISLLAFYLIGAALFIVIYYIQIIRIKIQKRKVNSQIPWIGDDM